MAKPAAVTVVKKLREFTYNWHDGHQVTYGEAQRVKHLVEQLPAFRAAPQTKNENTLRSIEALFRINLGKDLTSHRVEPADPYKIADKRAFILALARIINTHHGIKMAPLPTDTPSTKAAYTKKKPVEKEPVTPQTTGEMPAGETMGDFVVMVDDTTSSTAASFTYKLTLDALNVAQKKKGSKLTMLETKKILDDLNKTQQQGVSQAQVTTEYVQKVKVPKKIPSNKTKTT